MSCSTVQTGVLTATATAKSDVKAVKKAIRDVKKQGKAICVGGSCPNFGQSCKYKLGDLDIHVEQVIEPGEVPQYSATVQSSGRCKCE